MAEKSFEESLWYPATKLRGSVESSEYKHVALSLNFLKFVSNKFEEGRAELMEEGKEAYLDMVEFYTMLNVFYLPETSRWSHIQQQAKHGDIAIKIDSALTDVEKSNASLKGDLVDNYCSRFGLSANLGEVPADTSKDQHLDLKADTDTRDNAKLSLRRSQSVDRPRSGSRFVANPPFNLKDRRAAGTAMRDCPILETAGNLQAVREAKDNLVHNGRWNGYETPPTERSTGGKRVRAQLPKVRMPSLGYPPIHWKSCL